MLQCLANKKVPHEKRLILCRFALTPFRQQCEQDFCIDFSLKVTIETPHAVKTKFFIKLRMVAGQIAGVPGLEGKKSGVRNLAEHGPPMTKEIINTNTLGGHRQSESSNDLARE